MIYCPLGDRRTTRNTADSIAHREREKHRYIHPLKLQYFQLEAIGVTHFSSLVQDQAQLLAALPTRIDEVLRQLFDRLESGVLFSDESCSFSRSELVGSL